MTELFQYIAFVSMPGGPEWVVILIIGLLVFGRRLPEVARNIGKSVNEFKKGMREFQDSADEAVRDVNKVTSEVASEVKDASGINDYGYHEPDTTTSGVSPYESPESAATSGADPYGAPESSDATTDVAKSDAAPDNAGETDAKQSEHDPFVEPMK